MDADTVCAHSVPALSGSRSRTYSYSLCSLNHRCIFAAGLAPLVYTATVSASRPKLMDLLRGDEHVEQSFQHDQCARGWSDAPASERLNTVAPGLVILFRLEGACAFGQLFLGDVAHIHHGGMCRRVGIHHTARP